MSEAGLKIVVVEVMAEGVGAGTHSMSKEHAYPSVQPFLQDAPSLPADDAICV